MGEGAFTKRISGYILSFIEDLYETYTGIITSFLSLFISDGLYGLRKAGEIGDVSLGIFGSLIFIKEIKK